METFQISTIPSNHPEAQQSQIPQVQTTEQHAEPLSHQLPSLREQEEGINRLTHVAQQCSTEELHRVSEGQIHYNNVCRGRLTHHHSTPNMSLVPQHYHHHRQYDRQG